MGESKLFGGDLGDCIVTFGGDRDLVGDGGLVKAIKEVGLCLELLHGARMVLARGVSVPSLLGSTMLGEGLPAYSLGMSSDILPSDRLLSSEIANLSTVAGERCRGVFGVGGAGLLAPIMFSKRARRSDTGFYGYHQHPNQTAHSQQTYNGRAVRVFF